MKIFSSLFLFLVIVSCNNLEFTYADKKNLLNPLFEKTDISVSGVETPFIKSYIPMFFGNTKESEFNLSINIKEKKTKRSVESNQATSNLSYELRFFYSIKLNTEKCIVYEKEILSNFSITPKSGGYNYGTDTSLERKYELSTIENLNRFISYLSDVDLYTCK